MLFWHLPFVAFLGSLGFVRVLPMAFALSLGFRVVSFFLPMAFASFLWAIVIRFLRLRRLKAFPPSIASKEKLTVEDQINSDNES